MSTTIGHGRLVERFIARRYSETKEGRLQLRLYAEQEAAFEHAAMLEGMGHDVSAYCRKVLDDHARGVIETNATRSTSPAE